MSHDLDERIVAALEEVASDAPDLGPPPRRGVVGERGAASSAHPRRWLVWAAAAAATIVVTVGGLMALTGSPDDGPVQAPADASLPDTSPVDTSPAVPIESTPSSAELDALTALAAPDLGALALGEWLVATWVPDGYEMIRATSMFDSRNVVYERAAGDQVIVSTMATAGVDGARPDTDGWDVVVGDHPSASFRRDGWSVDVTASALDEVDLGRVVGRLGAVSAADLAVDVLDVTSVREDGALVASIDFNGVVEELHVSGGDGLYCMDGSAEGVCTVSFDPVDVISPVGGGALAVADGALRAQARSMGIAAPEVASIRFELIDGQTVDVVPTDLSGTFGVRFWLMATWIDLDEPAQLVVDGVPVDRLPAPVVGVTAFDAAGNVLVERDGMGF